MLKSPDLPDNKTESKSEMIEIHDNPSLDEVWDLCVRNFLYDQDKYLSELEALFQRLNISKESVIADLSAGGGFPAINLAADGYKIDCFDGFSKDLFDKNAKKEGVDINCNSVLWQDLPKEVKAESYDFVFCRGNSFIFAGGGWDNAENVDKEKALADYQKTMRIFADIIKSGGYLYIDKFKDSELGHREKLATINVGGKPVDLIFSSKRDPENKIREVFMEMVQDGKGVKGEKRITYDLSESELVEIMKESGFFDINVLPVTEEKHFDVWLAKKQ